MHHIAPLEGQQQKEEAMIDEVEIRHQKNAVKQLKLLYNWHVKT